MSGKPNCNVNLSVLTIKELPYMRKHFYHIFQIVFFLLLPSIGLTAEGATQTINSGDTSFLLICTALVMIMTPGLGFFYSGMVHSTNVVATIMHSYMKLCVISVVWVFCGYSLAFAPSISGLIGDSSYFGFKNVGIEAHPTYSNIPHILFATFQGMFAVITAAIITGAFAERVRLGSILIFSTLWVIFVYAPVAHWVWGNGWIASKIEPLDFAGGAVVHINSGIAGLVAALCLGRRVTVRNGQDNRPHNLPLMIMGGALLWFGWFGFNSGSALSANGIAAIAFANTNIAAAAGGVLWFIIESVHKGKSTSLGIISGSVAGLVSITPAAGFVSPISSILIGAGGGLVCYWAVSVLKPKLGYDDSLDAFGIHGIGGIWGAIATGIFASKEINPSGRDGLIYGNFELFMAQILSVVIVVAYSAIATYLILTLVRKFVRIRVSKEDEAVGLDTSQHGEIGYNLN